MSENQPSNSDETPAKKFRVTRKRLGTIRFVDPNGEYGFIEAEDFREDVFFHHSVWQPDADAADDPSRPGPSQHKGVKDQGQRGQGQRGQGQRGQGRRDPRARHATDSRGNRLDPEALVRQHVEFEIDDELFETEQKLRATVVVPTRRPMGRKMSGRDATFDIVTHHPRARRKRPDWRK